LAKPGERSISSIFYWGGSAMATLKGGKGTSQLSHKEKKKRRGGLSPDSKALRKKGGLYIL